MINVYHWTTKENAKKILKNGLKQFSFVCKNPNIWHGEICLKIINMTNWDDNEEGDWQALTSEHIPPEKISVVR